MVGLDLEQLQLLDPREVLQFVLELLGLEVDFLDQLHLHQLLEELVRARHFQDHFDVGLLCRVVFAAEAVLDLDHFEVCEACDPREQRFGNLGRLAGD